MLGGVNSNFKNFVREPPGTISGTITDSQSGAPVSNVAISVVDPPGVNLSTYSSNGTFSLDIPPGIYSLVAVHTSSGYFSKYKYNIQVASNVNSTANFSLTPKPVDLVVESIYAGDVDDERITMGDHGYLVVVIRNRGGPSSNETIIVEGDASDPEIPGVKLSDDGPWLLSLNVSRSWGAGSVRSIPLYIYIPFVDPTQLEPSGRVVPAGAPIRVKWQGNTIGSLTISIRELKFPSQSLPSGYGDLRGSDCLRRAGTSDLVRRFANYAAANRDKVDMSSDPDTRLEAARNIHERLVSGEEFNRITKNSSRESDEVLVSRRGGQLGDCTQWMDLSTGLLRAIGIETRDVYARGDSYTGHTWNEFYDGGRWVQFDAAYKLFDRNADLEQMRRIQGDENALSFRGDHWLAVCTYECIHHFCLLCRAFSGTVLTGCFEDRLADYMPPFSSALLASFSAPLTDSVAVAVDAPKKVIVGDPFDVSVILTNQSSEPTGPLQVSLDKKPWLQDSLDLYLPLPDSATVPSLASGAADTLTFSVTALYPTQLSYVTAVATDSTGSFVPGAAIQNVFDSQSASSLTIEDLTYTGNLKPSGVLHVEAVVRDDSLETESGATVQATITSRIDTVFEDSFAATYDSVDQTYQASYNIAADAPVGAYDLVLVAQRIGLQPDTLADIFQLNPDLILSLSVEDSTTASDSTTIGAVVMDRGDTVSTANVSLLIISEGGDSSAVSMTPRSTGAYEYELVPLQLNNDWGNDSFAAGTWTIEASAIYSGSATGDTTTLQVVSPDLVIDTTSVSIYPLSPTDDEYVTISATVINQGSEPSDSCFLDVYESVGDSLAPLVGAVGVSALLPGDSIDVMVHRSTAGWEGTNDVVLVVDVLGSVPDSDRSNNEATKVLTVTLPTGTGGASPRHAVTRLRQNYPNPFNPTTTIAFELASQQPVTLDIFDVRGAHVSRLVSRIMAPGSHEIRWDGENKHNVSVASGIYFYRLHVGPRALTRKMVLLK